MKTQELIKLWKEFIEWWVKQPQNTIPDKIGYMKKPDLYDFMDWLSENK